MRNSNKKLKRVYYINIILLVVNVAILVIWSMTPVFSSDDSKLNLNSNNFLKEELKLSEFQVDSIARLDELNFEHYQRILGLLYKNRRLLLKELFKSSPDKDTINKITLHIGHLHTALKRQTVNHLFNIKKVCNEDQQKKLEGLFEEILEVNNHCRETNMENLK